MIAATKLVKKPQGEPIDPRDPRHWMLVNDFRRGIKGCASVTKLVQTRPGCVAGLCHDGNRRSMGWYVLQLDLQLANAIRALEALTDERRAEVIGYYCKGCGARQPWHPEMPLEDRGQRGCQCQNDE